MDPATRGLLELAQSVVSNLDVETVLQRVVASAREVTGARYGAIGVLDDSRERLSRFITSGIDEQARGAIGAPPTGRGVLGELISYPVPLRLDDVGAHPHSYGFPLGHPPMTSFLGVPVLIDGEPYGNLYLTDKDDGEPFTEDDEETLVLLARFAGVAIDHARRFSGIETHAEELERTVEALDATLQISRALGGETDLDAILELVAKRGRALVSARTLVIEHLRGDELVVAAGAGELPPHVIGSRVPLTGTVAATALRTLRTERLDDELNRARFREHGLGRLGLDVTAGLVVPLVFRGHGYGVLLAADRVDGGPKFSATDQRLLEAFAASAAIAIATAESVAAEQGRQRVAAAEQERGRWARELHDETLQGLAALRFGLDAARAAGGPEELGEAVNAAVAQIDDEIASLRSLITDLRPAALDELGAEPAIEALAARARGMGLDVDLRIDLAYEQGRASERHVTELETAIYRIVQEALNNARTHGAANRSRVVIAEDDQGVHVEIRDDGRGFDPSASTTGFGLRGMRERVHLLGGDIEIASAPGEGTRISATFVARRRAQALRALGG